MKVAVVVGAGVSGAHAALTLLERGAAVELWDIGREEVSFPEPGASFHELKGRLVDPIGQLLGQDLGALIPPDAPELLRYPPARRFLASAQDALWRFDSDGFDAFGSFARGGLANGWGANALAYDDDDLRGWPVSSAEMEPDYRTVYRRIPVAGPKDDDLSPHLRGEHPSQVAVPLTSADERLLQAYRRKKGRLTRQGFGLGVARLAVITDPASAKACDGCDRCLWGCPRGSIYNPAASTLETCKSFPGFRYRPGREVLSLAAAGGKVTGIHFLDTASGEIRDEACDAVFLAAGALQTGAIFLRTLKAQRPDVAAETEGLMDTTVVKVPFLALRSIGAPPDARSFQFNRLLVGLTTQAPPWPRYLHGELLHLTSLVYHPLIERMPFDSRLSKRLFFALKSALGVVSFFFPDRITAGNRQVLVEGDGPVARVRLCYRESAEKEAYIDEAVTRLRSALWQLGCVPQGAVRSPGGGGIHYAGTVPMGEGLKRCDAAGRSNLLRNLFIADGAGFPSLPSKSITMSLAAHATRVARLAAL
jgi:choline dehydrogenase-like flavoprotein